MDFINFQAGEIFDEINEFGMSYEKVIQFLRSKAYLYENQEWLNLLKNIKSRYEKSNEEHLKICKAEVPTECNTNKWYIQVLYFLQKDIENIEKQVATSKPSNSEFSVKDMKETNYRIDGILSELEKLKMGQEIIWTDVMSELNELKEMYYLKKKAWRQILAGKLFEMVTAGVISETVSKKIIELVNPVADSLLN